MSPLRGLRFIGFIFYKDFAPDGADSAPALRLLPPREPRIPSPLRWGGERVRVR
jgi:hypothetical protein